MGAEAILQYEDGVAWPEFLSNGHLAEAYHRFPAVKSKEKPPLALSRSCDPLNHEFGTSPVAEFSELDKTQTCTHCDLSIQTVSEYGGQCVHPSVPVECVVCSSTIGSDEYRSSWDVPLWSDEYEIRAKDYIGSDQHEMSGDAQFACRDCCGDEWNVRLSCPTRFLDTYLFYCENSPATIAGQRDCGYIAHGTEEIVTRFVSVPQSYPGTDFPGSADTEPCPECGGNVTHVSTADSHLVRCLADVFGTGPDEGRDADPETQLSPAAAMPDGHQEYVLSDADVTQLQETMVGGQEISEFE